MLNSDEIGRIADAVTAVRPGWNAGTVADYLEENHANHPFDVLAAAAVFVAAQSMAKDLSWLEQDGLWWITRTPLPKRDAERQPLGRKRDEAWWVNFNLAQARRRATFGEPPFGETEEP